MVSATLRGAFGLKTKQELTQAEIRSILEQTDGELQKVWVDIQILEKDAPQTRDVEASVKDLVQNYRDLVIYRVEMATLNDEVTVKSDLSILKSSQKMAKQLRDNVSSLRNDVATTSKKIHGTSSRMDVNVVNRTTVTSEATLNGQSGSPGSGGFSNVFQTVVNIFIPPKKRNKKKSKQPSNSTDPSRSSSDTLVDSEHHSGPTATGRPLMNATDPSRSSSVTLVDSEHHTGSTETGRPPLNATDLSRFSSDTQVDSDSSVDGRPVVPREDTTYRIRLGYQTSTGEVIITGENQTELENMGWLGEALDGIREGRRVESQMAESQMHTIVQTIASQMSAGNMSVDNMSLVSEYVDAPDGLAAEELV